MRVTFLIDGVDYVVNDEGATAGVSAWSDMGSPGEAACATVNVACTSANITPTFGALTITIGD